MFGIVGYSGSGKTTLIGKLIGEFKHRDLTVSVVKHAHHGFQIDKPGKDSFEHREAGATEVLVSSAERWALVHELRGQAELELDNLLRLISPCDIVLVEGFKKEIIPKLEIRRKQFESPPLFKKDSHIIGIASDFDIETSLPVFGLTDYVDIADFILKEASNPLAKVTN